MIFTGKNMVNGKSHWGFSFEFDFISETGEEQDSFLCRMRFLTWLTDQYARIASVRTSNAVADAGFPRGGIANHKDGALTYYFDQFSQKLHENDIIWTPGACPWRLPWIRQCNAIDLTRKGSGRVNWPKSKKSNSSKLHGNCWVYWNKSEMK